MPVDGGFDDLVALKVEILEIPERLEAAELAGMEISKTAPRLHAKT